MNILRHFVLWVDVPIEKVEHWKVAEYTDCLLTKRLKPKTINCHLACIRVFYDYLYHEEGIKVWQSGEEGICPSHAKAAAPASQG